MAKMTQARAEQIRNNEMDGLTALLIFSWAFVFILFVMPAVYLMTTGDYPGAGMFYGLQEDHAIVDFLFTIREGFVR